MRRIDADLLRKNMEFICMGIMAGTDPYDAPLTEIDNAPTVVKETLTSERPTGEWEIIDSEGEKIWNCVCTECGHDPQEYIGGTENWWLRKPLPNFCSNCGVRIVNVKGG